MDQNETKTTVSENRNYFNVYSWWIDEMQLVQTEYYVIAPLYVSLGWDYIKL